jgi:hypothetical protein
LNGQAKITAELQKQLDIDKEKQRYTAIEEGERGNPRAHDAGMELRDVEDAGARAKARAEEIQLHRQQNDAIAALDEKTLESQLSGIALLEAQRVYAESEWVKAHGASARAIADIDDDYLAKVLAQYQKEDEAAEQKNAKLLAAQQQFSKEMDQIGGRSDDQQTEGYARIADMAAQKIQEVNDKWAAQEKLIGDVSTQAVDDQLIAADLIQQINDSAERQRQQLHAKTLEQITKEEEQAARMGLAPWQQAEAAIVDQYNDRIAKIKEDLQLQVMNKTEASRAVTAAWATANAEMQRSDEETRDKLASGLQSLFEHPEQFFEKRAMDTAFQMMANEMLGVFKSSSPAGGILQYMFGMGPQMSTGTNPLTDMESALGVGGHGHAGTSPGMAQFQQGATAFSAGTSTFSAAVSQFASAVTARGGAGIGSGIGGLGGNGVAGAGTSLLGLGGGVSTASGAGPDQDAGLMAGSSNPMMLPGVGAGVGALGSLATFGNGLAIPGMSAGGALSGSDINAAQSGVAASTNALAQPSALGAVSGIAGGGLMAASSIFSAYQNSNPLAGAMGGAMGGMEMGAAIGSIIPGLGTVVGGAIGAIAGGIGGLLAGIFGDKGRSQAEALDVNQIQPQLTAMVQDYEAGRSGYNTLAPELNSMEISAQNETGQWGSGARAYFSSNIAPEINKVLLSLQQQEIGGRSAITLSAGQYHSGGWTGDFGDLATSDTEGFIHAMQNEFVVNPMAAAAHAPILQAMNSGTNFAYSNSVQPRMPASSVGGSGPQITVQALDSKSVAQWAKAGGGLALMAALNQAQRQYSGVGRG